MIKMGKIPVILLIFICFLAIPAAAQDITVVTAVSVALDAGTTAETVEWTREKLQNIYIEHLRMEGYLPSVDVDGDIQFRGSGDNYFIIIDENDLQFFQVYTGFTLGAISMEDALNAANYSNRRSKVAKITVSSNGLIASVTAELLLEDPRDFSPVFARALSLIRNAEINFLAQLSEITSR